MSANYIPTPLECLLKNSKTIYGYANSVIKDVETMVVSFDVEVGKTFVVSGGSAAGKTDATYRFYIDENLKEKKYNAWTERNCDFDLSEKVDATKNVKITVEHSSLQMHDFNASIFGTYA